MSPEQQEDYVARNTGFQVSNLLSWAQNLTDEQKLQILDMFSSTYLRRDTKDMRPDLPEKTVQPNAINPPEGMSLNKRQHNWHNDQLMQMAKMKIPHTVQKASQYLSQPNDKVFIVTKHPAIAIDIVRSLSERFGDGVAAYVAGDTGEEDRAIIPDTFRTPNGILPGKKVPLRAIVYTMQLGAVGLNFSNAKAAIFNDMDWNPSDNLQAEFRVLRIDSQHDVAVDYMFFKGTYDEEMFKRVIRKQKVNEGVTNIMRQASAVEDPAQRLVLANQFVISLVDSLLFNLDLTDRQRMEIEQAKQRILTPAQSPMGVAAMNWFKRSTLKVSLGLALNRYLRAKIGSE